MKSLNTRLAGVEAEQSKEEEEILDIAKRRLQVWGSVFLMQKYRDNVQILSQLHQSPILEYKASVLRIQPSYWLKGRHETLGKVLSHAYELFRYTHTNTYPYVSLVVCMPNC